MPQVYNTNLYKNFDDSVDRDIVRENLKKLLFLWSYIKNKLRFFYFAYKSITASDVFYREPFFEVLHVSEFQNAYFPAFPSSEKISLSDG